MSGSYRTQTELARTRLVRYIEDVSRNYGVDKAAPNWSLKIYQKREVLQGDKIRISNTIRQVQDYPVRWAKLIIKLAFAEDNQQEV